VGFELFSFSPKASALLGLDISSSAVKMVELSSSGRGEYRVERYVIESLPKDAVVDGGIVKPADVEDAVRRASKRLSSSVREVAMALPASAVISKKIFVPAGLREDEMEPLVAAEASQYIPFAIDEVNLDYQVIGASPTNPDELEVVIAAARKEKVEERQAVAEAAGFKVQVMDVDSYATLAAFELVSRQLRAKEGAIIALIDIGVNATRLTVLRNGEPVYTRDQAFGGGTLTQDIARRFGMDYSEAEAAKREGSLPEEYNSELLPQFMDNLALEVSRGLQFFFTSTQFNKVDHVVLAGGCAAIDGIDELVATRTQVNTIVANPFAGMLLSSKVRAKNLLADASSLITACGLALRRFEPS
jgi:type IV pilus assembly protein PilM